MTLVIDFSSDPHVHYFLQIEHILTDVGHGYFYGI